MSVGWFWFGRELLGDDHRRDDAAHVQAGGDSGGHPARRRQRRADRVQAGRRAVRREAGEVRRGRQVSGVLVGFAEYCPTHYAPDFLQIRNLSADRVRGQAAAAGAAAGHLAGDGGEHQIGDAGAD